MNGEVVDVVGLGSEEPLARSLMPSFLRPRADTPAPGGGGDGSGSEEEIPERELEQRPYINRVVCGCLAVSTIRDGAPPFLCHGCFGCLFGGPSCDGIHGPIIPGLAQGYHRETADFLSRVINRLTASDLCRYNEILDCKAYATRFAAQP